jgi:predicted glycosyltransferase
MDARRRALTRIETAMRNLVTVALAEEDNLSASARCAAPKVLLYSHDTFGLGNIRRTLLLAESIGDAYPAASLLIVTGSPMIHAFRIPARTDYIKLPCLTRPAADRYEPAYLNTRASEVADIRAGVLERAILGFAPDLMIVDKRAAGIGGELIEPLRALRRMRGSTKIVLGIRDILDTPERTRLSLKRAHDMKTIARYYDEVWIYGEQSVFDAAAEYGFPPDVARKTRYCGYLKRPTRRAVREDGPPRVLVTTGGGEDGSELIETYLEGLIALPRSVALRTTVVFGPQMAAGTRDRLIGRFGDLSDVEFFDFDADLSQRYAAADVVVSMAGYNTVCELLSCAMRAVLVPRSRPVGEQLLRARLLAARGLFDVVEPDDLRPDHLMSVVLRRLQQPPAPTALDLDGLPRIHRRVGALLERGAS